MKPSPLVSWLLFVGIVANCVYNPLISPKERSFVEIVSCFVASCVSIEPTFVVMLLAKLPELSSACANSFNVSNAPGAPPIKLSTAVVTKAVVAICVVFVPDDAVGASGVPVNVGEESGA